MTQPFIIFALPRSRTKWLSEWLSYGGRRVGHDLLVECATPDEFLDRLDGLAGTVETSAMLAWRLIHARLPHAKFVTVRRPVEEVRASLRRLGIEPRAGELEERDAMLDDLEYDVTLPRWNYEHLEFTVDRDKLFEYLLGVSHDRRWDWKFYRNIQIDMQARMAYLAANQERIQNLKRLAREQEAALCLTSS